MTIPIIIENLIKERAALLARLKEIQPAIRVLKKMIEGSGSGAIPPIKLSKPVSLPRQKQFFPDQLYRNMIIAALKAGERAMKATEIADWLIENRGVTATREGAGSKISQIQRKYPELIARKLITNDQARPGGAYYLYSLTPSGHGVEAH